MLDAKDADLLFPAPAGMNRNNSGFFILAFSVPRASGDEPDAGGNLRDTVDLFPAPAGMNRSSASDASPIAMDYPTTAPFADRARP